MKTTALVTLVSILTSAAAAAAEPAQKNSKKKEPPKFEIKFAKEFADNIAAANRTHINSDGTQYTFLLPLDYKLLSDVEGKRVFAEKTDGSCSLTVTFYPPPKLEADQVVDHDYTRWRIFDHCGDEANITEETRTFAIGTEALQFDVSWRTVAKLPLQSRIIMIHQPQATIELRLLGNPKSFKDDIYALADLLASMQKALPGQTLEINRLSNSI